MKDYFTYEEKSPLLKQTLALMAKVKDIEGASSLLAWDQETYMPPGGLEARSNQTAALDVISHSYLISDEAKSISEKIRNFSGYSNDFQDSMFRLYLREYDKAVKLPENFVLEYSRAKTIAIESWKKAYKESDFRIYEKDLSKVIELKIQEAEYLGYENNRYDALIDLYEPGITVQKLIPIFDKLKNKSIDILNKLKEDEKLDTINDAFLKKSYPSEGQLKFSKLVADKMTFDFFNGRLDLSMHPFTTSFSTKDVRITTRLSDNELRSNIFSTIHELGHGLYEQGIEQELNRTFAADGASYGMHESQSLIWENIIARTHEFWTWGITHLRQIYPGSFNNIYSIDLYNAVNVVRPSLIRIEADELTYNLHIIIRFEIENLLINKKIKPYEIPDYWRNKYREYLGVIPPNDTFGCLQDIHWSHGSFGYFPSYTLGKLYAAMLWAKMNQEIPNLHHEISIGNFGVIRNWLKLKIHRFGKLETPEDLIMDVTGSVLNEEPFINYITKKIQDIYY